MKDIFCRIKDAWRVLTKGSYILIYPSQTGLDLSAAVNHPLFDALSDRLVKFIRNWYAQTIGKQVKQMKQEEERTDEAD